MLRRGLKFVAFASLFVFAQQGLAQSTTTVYGPEAFKASLKGTDSSRTFKAKSNSDGVLTLVNGDGRDLVQEVCKGTIAQKLICTLKNIATALEVVLVRPQTVDITLNGKKVVSSNFESEKGRLQVSVKTLTGQPVAAVVNQLQIKVKGSPLAEIKVDIKAQGSAPVNQAPIAQFTFSPNGGVAPISIQFSGIGSSDPDGQIASYAWDFGDSASGVMNTATGVMASHNYASAGTYQVRLTVTDNQGATSSITRPVVITADVTPPQIALNPASGTTINGQSVAFSGSANEMLSQISATSSQGSIAVLLDPSALTFRGTISVSMRGARSFNISAVDRYGNTTTNQVTYNFNYNTAPVARLMASVASGVAPLAVTFNGSTSTDAEGDSLSYAWNFGDGSSGSGSQVSHTYQSNGSYTARLTVTDALGLSSFAETLIAVQNGEVVPDPKQNAPPIAGSSLDLFQDQIRFLYQGPAAVQRDVAAGALKDDLVTLVRGKILGLNNQPLSGVRVSVPFSPEVGYTLTRQDGEFDLVVNGGVQVNLRFEKSGYLFADRSYRLEQLRTFDIGEVILVQPDSKVTTIAMNSASAQIAQSNQVTDDSGSRTATVVIPQDTSAFIVRPDGTRQQVSQMNVRITEYTVGENGPNRMPAQLPPSTNYTYAFDVSADEALSVGSKHIEFSKPVSYYVNNFLGFPVGSQVPYGIYDEVLGSWVGQPDGRVIRIVGNQNGVATISLSPDGTPATQSQLNQHGFDTQELTRLATAYPMNTELWRVRSQRFSPGDLNWIGTFVRNVFARLPFKMLKDTRDCPATECAGSRIDLNNLTLREDISLAGIPFDLHYNSRNSGGFKINRKFKIPVTSSSPPASLESITLEIDIAGQKHITKYQTAPDIVHDFVWDGKDVYGRNLASATADVTVRYNYTSDFLLPLINTVISFGYPSLSLASSNVPGRTTSDVIQKFSINLQGQADSPLVRTSIGGWSIDPVHFYDPIRRTLKLGNGDQVTLEQVSPVMKTVAGLLNSGGYDGEDRLGAATRLNRPTGLALSPDGSIIISDNNNFRIRKLLPSGTLVTILGTGASGDFGDGGPGVNAQIRSAGRPSVAADGSVYVPDPLSHKVRKISPDGIVTTVAGTGVAGLGADGNPLTSALNNPVAVGVMSDQSVLIAEKGNHRIRKISPDGTIRTIAGTGVAGFSGDGGAALAARLNSPNDLAVDPSDRIFVVDEQNRCVRLIYFGQISLFAGRGTRSVNFNLGTPAPVNDLNFAPRFVDVNTRGEVLLADQNYVLKVDSAGMVNPTSGYGVQSPFANGVFDQDHVKATLAYYNQIRGVQFIGDGSILVADFGSHRIRRITDGLPSFNNAGYNITSLDGNEIYQFNMRGRHLRTLMGRTGALKWEFSYDSSGNISTLKDENGLTTTIQRDANGRPVTIVGPFGKTHQLNVNADNQLMMTTNPNNESHRLTYNANGLLETFEKPNSARNTFQYNADGEISRDLSPEGMGQTLTKTTINGFVNHVRTTDGGKVTRLSFQDNFEFPHLQSQMYNYDGTSTTITNTPYTQNITNSARSYIDSKQPNLRLGSIAEQPISISTLSYPAFDRFDFNYTLPRRSSTNFFDFTEVVTRKQMAISDQLPWTTTYESQTGTFTDVSPLGRTSSLSIDSKERPIRVQSSNLTPTDIVYDDYGRIRQIRQGARLSELSYGSDGLLSSLQDSLGRQTTFARDPNGRVIRQLLPESREVGYRYNSVGEVTGITPPGKLIHEFIIDLAGQLLNYLSPRVGVENNQTISRYSADRDLIQSTRPDGSVLDYRLNANFLVDQIVAPRGTISINYNSPGFPDSFIVDTEGASVSATLMEVDGIVNQSYTSVRNYRNVDADGFSGGATYGYLGKDINIINYDMGSRTGGAFYSSIQYSRDEDRLLTGAGSMSIARNLTTGLIASTNLRTIDTSYAHNSFGEIERYSASRNGSEFFSESYGRDNGGRIISKVVTEQGVSNTFTYSYDGAGRLRQVRKNGSVRSDYSYDLNGNRTGSQVDGQATSGSYDAQDRLTSYNDTSYSYNPNGELIQRRGINNDVMSLSWNPFGQLISVQKSNDALIEYIVDGLGRRLGKRGKNERSWCYLNTLQIGCEFGADKLPRSIFIYGNYRHTPDYMMMVNGQIYRFVHDQLGSVRLVVEATTGAIAQRIEYDEFGKVLIDTNPGFQPFGFAGGHYDHDTGIVRFGARNYDPEIGRWISKDPIKFMGGDVNLNIYCGQDPVNCIDSNGMWGIQVGGGFAGMLGPIFGVRGGAESGIAISYAKEHGFQFAGYQSGNVGVGTGLFGGLGINLTYTPDAKQISDLGGGATGWGFDTPIIGGGVFTSPGQCGGQGIKSYQIGFGPGLIGDIYWGGQITNVGQPLIFGGGN